jgi:2-polyprenyl-6-methoxyphenol hydroxylase-like FAD-dependent oxidoreductase
MIGKVLVIGGGVGGMSAALALARRGAAVELADADPQWRAYGAGISVTGLSLRAFDDLGILDEVRDKGFVGAGIRLRGVDGSVIMETPPLAPDAPPVARSGGIMRPVLHEIMSRKVRESGIRVTLGAEIAGFEQDADGVTVALPDGRSERFDLVVAADGIFSRNR